MQTFIKTLKKFGDFLDNYRVSQTIETTSVSSDDFQIVRVAELDFTHVTNNAAVKAQGVITCVFSPNKGWYWIAGGKFPSRQDLAIITNVRLINLVGKKNV